MRVWIQEQRQRGAERQGRVGAVFAGGVCGPGTFSSSFCRRHGREDLAEAAELDGDHDDGDEGGDVDQDVLDDRDRCRRTQSAGVGEGRQHRERDQQRQIGGEAGPGDAERADHHLDADELQRDVRHGRDDAGQRDGQRQPAIAVAATHEVAGGDVAALVAHVPQARKDQEQDGIDDDGVRDGEEGQRAGAEGQRRNRDERVRGVQIAADQEPGDDGAEAPAAESPFVQLVEIALAPVGRGKPQPGNEGEQQYENAERHPVHVMHHCPRGSLRPRRLLSVVAK